MRYMIYNKQYFIVYHLLELNIKIDKPYYKKSPGFSLLHVAILDVLILY